MQVPARVPWIDRSNSLWFWHTNDVKRSTIDPKQALKDHFTSIEREIAVLNKRIVDIRKDARDVQILLCLYLALILYLPIWFMDCIIDIGKQLP